MAPSLDPAHVSRAPRPVSTRAANSARARHRKDTRLERRALLCSSGRVPSARDRGRQQRKVVEAEQRHHPDPASLASETSFTVNEVEALYELYKKMSFSIIKDGLIHKEEFQFALFRNSKKANLFADRVFDLFDLKKNGVIDFEEFVRSLSVFHPKTPTSHKTAFAFKLYDLRGTGYIEKEELREMVLALLDESDLCLSDSAVEAIVDNTFCQADSNGDGKIDPEEWEEFVKKNPAALRNMSLPYLQDITLAFPSFITRSEAND